MVTVETPRRKTVWPVGSEVETSFMAASPQVKSAVAATIAAMPLRLRRAACAASIWVNDIEGASELGRLLCCTLPPWRCARDHDLVRPLEQRLGNVQAERLRGLQIGHIFDILAGPAAPQ
jgi:hypothetical protein